MLNISSHHDLGIWMNHVSRLSKNLLIFLPVVDYRPESRPSRPAQSYLRTSSCVFRFTLTYFLVAVIKLPNSYNRCSLHLVGFADLSKLVISSRRRLVLGVPAVRYKQMNTSRHQSLFRQVLRLISPDEIVLSLQARVSIKGSDTLTRSNYGNI